MNIHEYNPDCGYAWMVVLACFIINFIMAGLARAAGVLYVALIEDFAISRGLAIAPFSLRFCVRNLSGPLVGALGQSFGVRPVVLLGGLISGIGAVICSIAPNITWITLAWGGLHGLGYGMCNIIHVIVLNRYFHKYKGLALGISLTGDCFGTFLLPIFLEFLLDVYALKGTFLILAGISLNIVPAAMILKSPPWEDMHENTHSGKGSDANVEFLNNYALDNKAFIYTVEDVSLCNKCKYSIQELQSEIVLNDAKNIEKDTEKLFCSPTWSESKIIDDIQVAGNSDLGVYNYDNFKNKCEINYPQASSLRLCDKTEKYGRNRFNFPIYNTHRKNSNISVLSCPHFVGNSAVEYLCNNAIVDQIFLAPTAKLRTNNSKETPIFKDKSQAHTMENSSAIDSYPSRTLSTYSEIQKDIPLDNTLNGDAFSNASHLGKTNEPTFDTISNKPGQSNVIKQFIKTNLKPIFLLICADMALYVFLFIAVFTIIIDYASDNNVPSEYGKLLIIAFSVTDVFGRILCGIILDKQWIAFSYYAGLTTGLMGLFIFIIPFSKSFLFWITSFSVCGFIQGGVAIMYPVLVDHYMEKSEATVALGCLNFYGGLLMLAIPSMIGYFRDNVGSYDGVFWTTGGLCMCAGCLWVLEPCLIRRQQKRSEIPQIHSDEGKSDIL